MDSGQIAQGLYLLTLGAAVAGSLILQARARRGELVQQLAIWALIFVGTIAGFGLWSEVSRSVLPQEATISAGGAVSIPQSPDGHYHVTLKVQGVPVRFMVDTGASSVVLTPRDARRIGIDPATLAYLDVATTANGSVATAPVRLHDVRLGEIVTPVLRAQVNKAAMPSSLLGMSYLRQFAKIEIVNRHMVLTP